MATIYEKAILDTIAYAEGTIGVSQNGYDVLFGFYTIDGWTENTDIKHRCLLNEKGVGTCEDPTWKKTFNTLTITAAGRYQFLGSSWASATKRAGLGENAPMTKDNQDKAALANINKKRGVSSDDLTKAYKSFSDFELVRNKLKSEWTSLDRNDISARKTPKEYWDVFKFAVEVYRN